MTAINEFYKNIESFKNSGDSVLLQIANETLENVKNTEIEDGADVDDFWEIWNYELQNIISAWTLTDKIFKSNSEKELPIHIINKNSGAGCDVTHKQAILYYYIMSVYALYEKYESGLMKEIYKNTDKPKLDKIMEKANVVIKLYDSARLYFRLNWFDEYMILID